MVTKLTTAERTKLTEPCLNGWLQPPQNSCWHWVHLKCRQPPLARKKRNLHFGQSERGMENVTTLESSNKKLCTKNLLWELLLYLFCSCWGAVPALSFGTRGYWAAPTLWTSHTRFLHAVKPTKKTSIHINSIHKYEITSTITIQRLDRKNCLVQMFTCSGQYCK